MKRALGILFRLAVSSAAFAGIDIAPIETGHDRNPSPLHVGLKRIGTLRPRSANEIVGSNWTLGCECLDRDFTRFDEYKDYIVPLGIKEIRLFAGWAKCERKPGTFDFAWLDHCVDWANANGINVYLDVSYGNPAYKGAGGAGLANGMPNTPEGLAAWDRWIEKLGEHYKGRIRDFATWNEPDNGGKNSPAVIADLCVRTARILKRVVPDCRMHGLSLASNSPNVFESCIAEIAARGGVELFDTFIYHGYAFNPDSSYERVEKLKEICAKYAPNAAMRQGENGCVSEWSDRFALSHWPWSEYSQAKWDMRRMLGDLGHGCRSTVYSICDLQYEPPYAPYVYLNRKGILRANAKHQVYQIKKAYYAIQNVVAVFDDTLRLVPVGERKASTTDRCTSLYEYGCKQGAPLLVFWDHGLVLRHDDQALLQSPKLDKHTIERPWMPKGNSNVLERAIGVKTEWRSGIPSDDFTTRLLMIEWRGAAFKDPVWVDLFTGAVYEVPAERQIVHSCGISFVRIPVYDSPCLLTERKAVQFSEMDSTRGKEDRLR